MNTKKESYARFVLRNLPGAAVAVVGLCLFLLALESTRLPAVQTVVRDLYGYKTSYSSFIALIIVGVLLYVFRKKINTVEVNNVIFVIVGTLLTFSLYFNWKQILVFNNDVVAFICDAVQRLCYMLLFFFWMKKLYSFGQFTTLVVFGMALILEGVICSSITIIRAEASVGLLALMPIVSSGCLCGFAPNAATNDTFVALEDNMQQKVPAFSAKTGSKTAMTVIVITIVVAMACFAIVFGQVHRQWIVLQDNAIMSMTMQLGIAVGTIVAGAVVLFFVDRNWTIGTLSIYFMLVVAVSILALLATSLITGSMVFFYLALLNFAQKSIFFFMCAFPFFIRSERSALWLWVTLYLGFEIGKFISITSVYVASEALHNVVPTVMSFVLLLCGVLVAYLVSVQTEAAAAAAAAAESATLPVDLPINKTENKFKRACKSLANEKQLTAREYDSFVLLARGRTAAYISEELVVSPKTMKVYIRNVYAKLGVHNQQDLISMVEERIDEISTAGE